MFNEPASSIRDRHPRPSVNELRFMPQQDERLETVRVAVMQVMSVEAERLPENLNIEDLENANLLLMMREPRLLIRFEGRLTLESDIAFDKLEAALIPLNMTVALREAKGKHLIYVVDGRAATTPRNWVWNALLLAVTFLSVLYVGADMHISERSFGMPEILAPFLRADFNNNPLKYLLNGLPYAISILLILGAHEMGHYFAARRRGIAVTLPYFLPLPFGLTGTLGAFIQLREPMKNRRILFEIGAAGPLAGLIFAVPILFIGLATSQTAPIGPGLLEGNSLFYAFAKRMVFGDWIPNAEIDVLLNQMAWAGWTGLLITGLNLLPIGQLDGGHVIYSLIGERAKYIYFPAIIGLAALTALTDGALLFMLILLVFFGRAHAVPLDNITPLDPRRRLGAIFTLAIFVLVFVPVPLMYREITPVIFGAGAMLPTAVAMLFMMMRHTALVRNRS